MIKELANESEFNELISKGDVLIDFNATWCGPCKMLAPNLEKLSDSYKNLTIISIDVDKFNSIAAQFSISSIPTLILFKEGKIIKKNIGYLSYLDLETFIK